eukprot:scaffold80122_cov71-Cyclotella_meneghiniana.AAC.2
MGQCNDYGGCDRACKIARLVKASSLWSVVMSVVVVGGGWYQWYAVAFAYWAEGGVRPKMARATPRSSSLWLGCLARHAHLHRCVTAQYTPPT